MKVFVLLAVLVVAVSAVAVKEPKKDYTGHRLITVKATTKADLDVLETLSTSDEFEELDFWTEPSIRASTDVRVSPNDFGKFMQAIQAANMPFIITNDNIQQTIDEENASNAKAPKSVLGCAYQEKYCTLDEIYLFIDNVQRLYPDNMQVTTIGQSAEGRDLYQVKIAKDMNNPKPAIWIEAGTHAREWISVSSGLTMMVRLAANTETTTEAMLSKYDWYIIPVHNPDGYVYSHESQRLWRKNRQSCQHNFYRGIDLNRNWDADFGGAGTSSSCSSDVYRGRFAFEAVEDAALRDAVWATPNVLAFFSIHSYSQYMLVPYAYTSAKPARYADLYAVADEMMKQLETVDGRYFVTGTPPDILYAASGGAYDYFYLNGVPWSYTYELRPAAGTSNGFVLDPSQIPMATEEVFVSLWAFATMNLPSV